MVSFERLKECELEANNTVYLPDIDAEVDNGIVTLVEYFNNELDHPTEFSCSGLLKDHYDLEQLSTINSCKLLKHHYFLRPPFVMLEPLYHTSDGQYTIINKEFHKFRSGLPQHISIHLTQNNFSQTTYKHILPLQFTDRLLQHETDNQDARYKYTYHIGTYPSLSQLFQRINYNTILYDEILEKVLELIPLLHTYPRKIFEATQIHADVDTEDLKIVLPLLDAIPEHINEDDVEQLDTAGNTTTIVGTIDQIREHICNDEEYIEQMTMNNTF